MPAPADRAKALEAALSQIDRQFGKGSIMRLGDEGRAPVEVIPTGSIALDIALGIGGLPRGRVVEIYGPESSGKTTLALHAVANAQKAGAIDVVVVDSVAALVPKAEIEGEMGDSHVGLQARLMSQALRKIAGALSNSGTTAIFDNLYGVGISREGGLIDLGVEQGFVRKSGAWYTYEGDQLGQGKENARTFLKDNPDLADEIEKKIKEKLGIGARVDAPAETAGPVDF